MYSLVSAVLKAKGRNQGYTAVDISVLTMSALFENYVDGHITLTNPTIGPNPLYVYFTELKQASLPFLNINVLSWFTYIGDTPLPLLPFTPSYTDYSVVYSNAYQAGFELKCVDPSAPIVNPYACHNDAVNIIPSNLTDLYVAKPNISVDDLFDYTLCTVNGFLHRKNKVTGGVTLIGGGITARALPTSNAGIISFLQLGKVTEHAIDPEWVNPIKPNVGFKEGIVLETGLDFTNKTVMVSIAGYLHVNDTVIEALNDTGTILLRLSRIEWIRRLLDMQDYMDIGLLGMTKSSRYRKAFTVSETQSDAFYGHLLELVNSFIILVDCPRIVTGKIATGKTPINGLLDVSGEPIFPLLHATGRFSEYDKIYDNGKWVVKTRDTLYREYLYETTDWELERGVNVTLNEEGLRNSVTHMLSIKTSLFNGH